MTVHSAIFASDMPETGRWSYVSGRWHPCPPGFEPCVLSDRGYVVENGTPRFAWSQSDPSSITGSGVREWADQTVARLLRESPGRTPLIGLDVEDPAALPLLPLLIESVRASNSAAVHLEGGGNLRVGFWIGRLFASASPWGDGPRVATAAATVRDSGWIREALAAGGTPLCCIYPTIHEQQEARVARLGMAVELAVYRAMGHEPVAVAAPQWADPGPAFSPEYRAQTLSALCDADLLDAQFRAANYSGAENHYDAIVWGAPTWRVGANPGGYAQPEVSGTHAWRELEPRLRSYVGSQPIGP